MDRDYPELVNAKSVHRINDVIATGVGIVLTCAVVLTGILLHSKGMYNVITIATMIVSGVAWVVVVYKLIVPNVEDAHMTMSVPHDLSKLAKRHFFMALPGFALVICGAVAIFL